MKNFTKNICIKCLFTLLIVALFSACTEEPKEEIKQPESQPKQLSEDNVLKGYQDQMQKAKDMEKKILEDAEKQKKAIDDLTK